MSSPAATTGSWASSLAKRSGVVAAMSLLSRSLGFVRDALFATVLGANPGMDVFLLAFRLPSLFRRLLAEGAFAQAFLPILSQQRSRQGEPGARALVGITLGTLFSTLALLTLLAMLAAPLLLWLLAPGFAADPGKAALGSSLLYWTLPCLLAVSLTALSGSILNAYGQFALPAFTPVVLNLCLIAAVLLATGSVETLAQALCIGCFAQVLLQLPWLQRLKMLPPPRWAPHNPELRRVLSLMAPTLIGANVGQLSLLLDSIFASLLQPGSVSWLYYAERLMEFPLSIFSIAVATAILPSLASQHAAASAAQFSATLDWGLRTILLIAIPASLGLLLLAEPIVTTLFAYGAFDSHDARMTAWALRAYALGFFGLSLVRILVQGYYARLEVMTPVRYGLLTLLIGLVLSLGLMAVALACGFAAPHAALALGSASASLFNAGCLLRRLRREQIWQPAPGWRRYGGQLLLASAAMAVWLSLAPAPLADWLSLGGSARALKLGGLIAAAVLIYFPALLLSGYRFRRPERSQP